MPVHLLSDVDVVAVSLVEKGANRKRFYLRKSHGELEATDKAFTSKIVKADDWSVVYCVVAEPGNLEDAGIGDGQGSGVDDMWASDDEIRKAAHRFMKNGGLVNKLHQTLDPYGSVVENFIAQSDMTVGDEVIKQGSWVIGINPSDEGRQKIEAGEFSGVSIQGTGVRTPSEDEKPTVWKRLGSLLGVSATLTENREEDDELPDEKLHEKVEAIEKQQTAATTAIQGLTTTVDRLLQHIEDDRKAKQKAEADAKKADEENDGEPKADAENLQKSLNEVSETLMKLAGKLDDVEKDVSAIADNGSTQDDNPDHLKKAQETFWGAGIL